MPSTEWILMGKLVQSIFGNDDAAPFREPVDWKGLGLYDYPQIVKKPMDLGQIKRKIEKEEYATLRDAAEDVRLVWKNCKTYNADGSDFYLLATDFSKKFEDKYSKLLKELKISNPEKTGVGGGGGSTTGGIGASTLGGLTDGTRTSSSSSTSGKNTGGGNGTEKAVPEPSVDDKKLFAKKLYKISKEELGKVIIELDTYCPISITKNSAEDQVEINVDNISPEAFRKVMDYVNSCVEGSSGNRKKRNSSASSKGKNKR